MIQSNNLRTGNLVLRKNKFDRQFRETVIVGQMIWQAEREPDEFEPIPLTAEWLERFGFKEERRDSWGIYDEFGFSIPDFEIERNNSGELRLSVNVGEYHIGKPIEYVHQLQNLYFALTGQELVIKEKA